ncbi:MULTISPECIES: CopD family protein [Sphingobacterium]|jgi:putative membrane protein|uniref:CopD family protein n=1 Tax=Sphingobacterium TaxID=28453 RepID=UPI000B9BF92A|nr:MULTISPECIES: CopD family protein [Sphingobacterium]WGQ13456.1 CopD family protein [Sphingobacterium faecium]HCU45766.1 CopD family protein [Sphingobacterium sp.]
MVYLYAKAIHIIFVICWMAGLFYMPRLFIYHTEAKDQSKEAYHVLHKQFSIMENRLWWVITTPAMYITVISALVMLYINPGLLQMGWMQVKLLFVAGMIVYHFVSQRMMFNLRDEKSTLSSSKLRMWNEVSTVLLFSIVFTVVLKSALNWIYGVVGLISLAILLMVLIKAYKKYRISKGDK